MNQAWIYILANHPNGTLSIGVTTALTRRIHAGPCAPITASIRREKQHKTWSHAWKIRLIEIHEPGRTDLYDQLTGGE